MQHSSLTIRLIVEHLVRSQIQKSGTGLAGCFLSGILVYIRGHTSQEDFLSVTLSSWDWIIYWIIREVLVLNQIVLSRLGLILMNCFCFCYAVYLLGDKDFLPLIFILVMVTFNNPAFQLFPRDQSSVTFCLSWYFVTFCFLVLGFSFFSFLNVCKIDFSCWQ